MFKQKKLIWVLLSIAIFITGCATADIVPMGTNTYMISQTSAGGAFKSMSSLKSGVMQRANTFAESRGMVAIPVVAKESPAYPGHMPNFEYQFTLVNKNDPRAKGFGLTPRADMVIENNVNQRVENLNRENKPKDIYAELLRLDDLKKKNIITDAEFDSQKQKLLNGN